MCGIFGVFSKAGKLPPKNAIERSLKTLAHRGPDAEGILWQPERGLALGHTRLSIIDPTSRSDQPFITANCALIFNGEIYNFKELREKLLQAGAVFSTSSDTEVIVRGYEHWGADIFSHLRGMYAFALYDYREETLHLARDEFGIKPLCFLRRGGSLYFASEIKPIAALNSLAINGETVVDLLRWGFQMENSSLYSGIEFLAPGTHLIVRKQCGGNLQILQSTIYPPQALGPQTTNIEARNLRETIIDSVEKHLIADVPIALALSGGLDSSIVAAVAAKRHPGLHAYTLTLGNECDPEVEHAKLLCRQVGIKHHIAKLTSTNLEGWLSSVAWHLEESVANINVLLSYGLAALIRSEGFKVALVGEGADELFGGYPWYGFALDPMYANNVHGLFDAYHRRRAHIGVLEILRPAAFAAAEARLAHQRENFARTVTENPISKLEGFLSFDRATQLQYSQLLRVDRMFMAHGVEARVPYLYDSVLRASAMIPATRKLCTDDANIRSEKIALAEAFLKDLPQAIACRPKFGPQGTVNTWNTWLARALQDEFKRCLYSEERKGARQLLAEFIDWNALETTALSAKDKFAITLMLEAVDAVLLSRSQPDESRTVQWDFEN